MPVHRLGIHTGETYFKGTLEGYAKNKLARIAHAAGVELPPLSEVADVKPLVAFVNEGRWLVGCPCGADYQLAFSLYMCASCWNEDVGGEWRPVAYPENRDGIETLLLERRKRQHMNYHPGDDLAAENAILAETGGLR